MRKLDVILASRKGKRILNIMYSWGAAVVIIGALFKLLHWPLGDQMLFIGMMTEFLIFFISGFEKPEENYKWEKVYPELKDGPAREHNHSAAPPRVEGVPPVLPEEDLIRLREGISRLSEAADRLAQLGHLSQQTQQQLEMLAHSPVDLGRETEAYRQQMAQLTSNLEQLNDMYRSQLSNIGGQVQNVDRINQSLDKVREMFDRSVSDSHIFQNENAIMARQLQELNAVYARLLEAMTVNMAPMTPSGYRSSYGRGYTSYPPEQPHVSPSRDRYGDPAPRDPYSPQQ